MSKVLGEMALFLAKWTQTDYLRQADVTGKPQLLAIPYSHYCELAAWSLEHAGKGFTMHAFAPAQHVLPVLALRHHDARSPHLSKSSFVQAANADGNRQELETKSRSTAVPVLAMPDGRVLVDSWEIAQEAGIPAIEEANKRVYDEELGPLVRQFGYAFILSPTNRNIWDELCTQGKSFLWRTLWGLGLGSQVTKLLVGIFASSDAQAISECRVKLVALVKRLDERVRGRKGPYLSGDQIGLDDVALASLAAPLVYPDEYCGGAFNTSFKKMEAQDAKLREELAYWRSTETGQYVLKLYKERRMR